MIFPHPSTGGVRRPRSGRWLPVSASVRCVLSPASRGRAAGQLCDVPEALDSTAQVPDLTQSNPSQLQKAIVQPGRRKRTGYLWTRTSGIPVGTGGAHTPVRRSAQLRVPGILGAWVSGPPLRGFPFVVVPNSGFPGAPLRVLPDSRHPGVPGADFGRGQAGQGE